MTYYRIKGSDTLHKNRKCSYLRKTSRTKLKSYRSRPGGELCDRCANGRG